MNLFKQLDIKTIQEILVQKEKGFCTYSNGEGIVYRYNGHFNLHCALAGHFIENWRRLGLEYRIPNQLSYDEKITFVLQRELEYKQIELATMMYNFYTTTIKS